MSISKIRPAVLKALTLTAAAIALLALPVLAQDGGASGGEGGGPPPPQGLFGGNFLFIMAAMFAIIYFFMIRPEQRKQKERQKMLAALKKGDKVLTIGGLVGVITAVKDSTYIVKSGEGAVFEVTKSAISSLLNDTKEISAVPTAEMPAPDAKENK
ncbi:preprotein translocase YajC subunit [Fibrobacteres bacterium R8-0-B4]